MTSSKKQRGKQRKAAKNRAAASNKFAPSEITFIPDPNRENTITLLHPEGDTQLKFVSSLVQNGHNAITGMLWTLDITNLSLKDSGVVPVILNFLQRWECVTLDKVMAEVRGNLQTRV